MNSFWSLLPKRELMSIIFVTLTVLCQLNHFSSLMGAGAPKSEPARTHETDLFPRDSEGMAIIDAHWSVFPGFSVGGFLLFNDARGVVAFSFALPRGSGHRYTQERRPELPKKKSRAPQKCVLPEDAWGKMHFNTQPIFQPFNTPSVGANAFQFPCLDAIQCQSLTAAARTLASSTDRKRFNYMGIHIHHTIPSLWSWLGGFVEKIDLQHPLAELHLKSAFFVRYTAGQRHEEHMDKADITLNICVGDQFAGGALRLVDPTNDKKVAVPHKVGHAILHHGYQSHDTCELDAGERINLILWCTVLPKLHFWPKLPQEVQHAVLSYLDPSTFLAIVCTSKANLKASNNDEPWKQLFSRNYPELWKRAMVASKEYSFQQIVKAQWKAKTIPDMADNVNSSRKLVGNDAPTIMMKQTCFMQDTRQERELEEARRLCCSLVGQLDGPPIQYLEQKLKKTPLYRVPCCVPWYIPPSSPANWTPLPNTSQEDSPTNSADGDKEVTVDIQIIQPEEKMLTKHKKTGAPKAKPVNWSKPSFEIVLKMMKDRHLLMLDTDGTDLCQYSWFFPLPGFEYMICNLKFRMCSTWNCGRVRTNKSKTPGTKFLVYPAAVGYILKLVWRKTGDMEQDQISVQLIKQQGGGSGIVLGDIANLDKYKMPRRYPTVKALVDELETKKGIKAYRYPLFPPPPESVLNKS